MPEKGPKVYRPCTTGLKCPGFYLSNYQRRVDERGPENQGTGDIVTDLKKVLQALNSTSIVEGRDCNDGCPIPGERSNVDCPDGISHKVFFEDLPGLVQQFEKNV